MTATESFKVSQAITMIMDKGEGFQELARRHHQARRDYFEGTGVFDGTSSKRIADVLLKPTEKRKKIRSMHLKRWVKAAGITTLAGLLKLPLLNGKTSIKLFYYLYNRASFIKASTPDKALKLFGLLQGILPRLPLKNEERVGLEAKIMFHLSFLTPGLADKVNYLHDCLQKMPNHRDAAVRLRVLQSLQRNN